MDSYFVFYGLIVYFRSDSEYLSTLDETRWLKYISELLRVSGEVSSALHKGASVAVCYEAGWDRTTQVSCVLINAHHVIHLCFVGCVIGTTYVRSLLSNYGRFSGMCVLHAAIYKHCATQTSLSFHWFIGCNTDNILIEHTPS